MNTTLPLKALKLKIKGIRMSFDMKDPVEDVKQLSRMMNTFMGNSETAVVVYILLLACPLSSKQK